VLADQAPEALGGFLGAALDHCQAAMDVVRVAIAYFVVVVAVLVTAAAARMAAAVQPLDDAAERSVNTLDVVAVELAPDSILELLQLAMRLGDKRLGCAAGGVVIGTRLRERSAGAVELLPVRGVVLGLHLDAVGLALQLVQQTWVTAGAPFVVSLPATVLCVVHLVLLSWLSARSGVNVTGPLLATWTSERARAFSCGFRRSWPSSSASETQASLLNP
jgi:hypothetical protein